MNFKYKIKKHSSKKYILLWIKQRIIHLWWKYFCFKKCKVYNMQYENGYRFEKIPCPIIYIEYKTDSGIKKMPVDLYYSFGGVIIKYINI